jgi:hypothetical protein
MKRREFIALLGDAVAARPFRAAGSEHNAKDRRADEPAESDPDARRRVVAFRDEEATKNGKTVPNGIMRKPS